MSKHTPGPWIYYADLPSQDPDWHIVTTENRLRILANVHIEPGNQVDEANARLIAAAPELLEALVQLEEAFCSVGPGMTREDREDSRAALIAARAAIAKARGDA